MAGSLRPAAPDTSPDAGASKPAADRSSSSSSKGARGEPAVAQSARRTAAEESPAAQIMKLISGRAQSTEEASSSQAPAAATAATAATSAAALKPQHAATAATAQVLQAGHKTAEERRKSNADSISRASASSSSHPTPAASAPAAAESQLAQDIKWAEAHGMPHKLADDPTQIAKVSSPCCACVRVCGFVGLWAWVWVCALRVGEWVLCVCVQTIHNINTGR